MWLDFLGHPPLQTEIELQFELWIYLRKVLSVEWGGLIIDMLLV